MGRRHRKYTITGISNQTLKIRGHVWIPIHLIKKQKYENKNLVHVFERII